MCLREIGCEGVGWIHLAQDEDQWWAVVNTVMHHRVPKRAGNFFTTWVTICLLRRALLPGVRLWSPY
jgi:hypothetical protein